MVLSLPIFDGSLLANGKVYLVNPNGVVIGSNGKVQAAHFVASCLNISDEEFLHSSEFHFQETLMRSTSI